MRIDNEDAAGSSEPTLALADDEEWEKGFDEVGCEVGGLTQWQRQRQRQKQNQSGGQKVVRRV